jgi:CcmD family protein
MIRKLLLSTFLFFISFFAFAQDTAKKVDMADTMRSNGKIFVVLAVVLAIFTGIIIYLIRLDMRIGKLEKENRLPGFPEK